jgi:hypothetical protein
MEQLWKVFHNFSYRRSVVMESTLLQDGRKSVRDRPFRFVEP